MKKNILSRRGRFVAVFSSLLFMFSCMAQPTQVANSPVNQVSSSPIGSTTGPTPGPDSTLNPSLYPTINPTGTPVPKNYIIVWSAVSGNLIVDTTRTESIGYYYLLKGNSTTFNSQTNFINGSNETSYSSSNPDILSVDNTGNVTALNEGTAQIIIKSKQDPNLSAKIEITVTKPISPIGLGQTGCACDIPERATFNGKVYDFYGKPVERAKVTAKVLQPKSTWVGEDQFTTNGSYVFRNAPIGSIIEINVSKEGWTTQTQYLLTKSNLTGDPEINILDFGGPKNQLFAIQDEPQINSVMVNEQAINTLGLGDPTFNLGYLELVNSTNLIKNSDKVQFKFEFSEPIDRASFETSARLTSQKLPDSQGNLSVNDETKNIKFNWGSDDRSVIAEIDHKLPVDNKTGYANYLFSFSGQGFKDRTGKQSIKGKYFVFNNSVNGDFFVFRISNLI
jgi:hypothetical protein